MPFDPTLPFIAEDGYEYDSLADYICGRKSNCIRNSCIKTHEWFGRTDGDLRAPEARRWIVQHVYRYTRDGHGPANYPKHTPAPSGWLHDERVQFAPCFEPYLDAVTGAEGAGQPHPGPAQAPPLRQTGEPEVQRWLGPRGHL